MKKIIFPLLFLPLFSNACINAYGGDLLGNYTEKTLEQIRDMDLKDSRKNILSFKKQMEDFMKGNPEGDKENATYLNELAVCDIFLGDYEAAKSKLFKAAAINGFGYSITSNLGVAYELSGNLDSAYYYTSRGLKMSPYSHNGSEWIHVKILEAEKMEKESPGWINTHPVLSIDPNQSESQLERLIYQISFQLHERMIFVKPENKFVASVLFTLGQLEQKMFDHQGAIGSFKMAAEYDSSLQNTCDQLILDAGMKTNGSYDKVIEARRSVDVIRISLFNKKQKALYKESIHALSKARLSAANLMVLKAKRKNRTVLYGSLLSIGLIVTVIIIKKRSA